MSIETPDARPLTRREAWTLAAQLLLVLLFALSLARSTLGWLLGSERVADALVSGVFTGVVCAAVARWGKHRAWSRAVLEGIVLGAIGGGAWWVLAGWLT